MPLIYPPQDPRRKDSRLYAGGGDGGAGEMREQEADRQRKVQSAVDAINARFGIAPTGEAAKAPTAEDFFRPERIGYFSQYASDSGDQTYVPDEGAIFDESGYTKALADFNRNQVDVGAAKTEREKMYTDISSAVKDTALRDLDRQYTQASQRNKFGLARSGLLGGSVDAEAGGELQTLYGEGKLKASQAGMQAASDLRATDEKTRQNLISLAQSGIDTGTASSLAAGQMGAAADLAKSQTQQASVGRLFDDLGQAYLINQTLKARYPNGAPQQPGAQGYGSANLFGAGGYTGRVQN